MNREIAMKWIADLRANQDKQGTGALCSEGLYCCLGRLVIVAGFKLVELDSDDLRSTLGLVIEGTDEWEELTDAVAESVDMKSRYGSPANGGEIVINYCEYYSLVKANDEGCTFAQIADWIEQNYERL